MARATEPCSVALKISCVKTGLAQVLADGFYRTGRTERPAMLQQTRSSGTKSGRFNQTHLIASGGELAALIALHDNTTPGFDADHPGTHPAKSGRLQHLDNITGLQIQLHLRKNENGEQGSSNAPWRT